MPPEDNLLDFLIPVLGSVTGIDPAHWKDILVFTVKVIVFCVPFIVLGILVERDILKVPVSNRVVKIAVLIIAATPFFLLGALNFMAPKLGDAFWDKYPYLEDWWILEGEWTPILFMGFIAVFVILYTVEVMGGDLSR